MAKNLNTHHPESLSSPVQKMSGWIKNWLHKHPNARGKGWTKLKKFYNRKRRRILNNRQYDDKI